MSLSASLANVGHPVAYYPRLARFFGSVNVAILFAQLHYWGQRCESDLGTYKTSEEFTEETGLSYREQATARKHLRQAGFLIETPRRLEHRVYFRLNLEAVDAAFDAWTEAQTKAQSPNDENAFREIPKAQFGNVAKRSSGDAANAVGGVRQTHSVISTETPTETTAETTADISSPPALQPARGGGNQAKADAETELQAACRETWAAYSLAFEQRYGVKPVRNAVVNANVKTLVKRLGYAEAPLVAAWYVRCVNEQFVVKNSHGVGVLVNQAESYRTQWARGQAVTATAAQAADKTSANLDAIEEAKRLMRGKQGGQGNQGNRGGEVIDA